MANLENIKRLRARIAAAKDYHVNLSMFIKHPVPFTDDYNALSDLRNDNECGTVACIAGYAVSLMPESEVVHYSDYPEDVSFIPSAAKFLDLSLDEAKHLCAGIYLTVDHKRIALNRLDKLIAKYTDQK